MEDACAHGPQLAALETRCRRQAAQITEMREALERKNRELDALHYVWCDGGCPGGVHRWTDGKITADVVRHAQRQTRRLAAWYGTVQMRRDDPRIIRARGRFNAWISRYYRRAAAKTDITYPAE